MKRTYNSVYQNAQIQVLASCQGICMKVLREWVDELEQQRGKKTRIMNRTPLFSKRKAAMEITHTEVFTRPVAIYSNLSRDQRVDLILNTK